MLTIIGLTIIVLIVFLLLTEKVSPIICLTVVPFIGALLAGFDLHTITNYYNSGIGSVTKIAIMFVFAILFFGVLNDAGLFNPIINAMITLTKGNILAITVVTVLISVVAHMDGAGASTFLLVVPALLPLYKRLSINPYVLFLLLTASAGVSNMLPWGGPLGRLSVVLQMDVVDLWKPLIPLQIIGIFIIILIALILGIKEKRRIANLQPQNNTDTFTVNITPNVEKGSQSDDEATIARDFLHEELSEDRKKLLRPKLFWINASLFVLTLVALVSNYLPAGYIFMLALCLVLLINYPKPKMQLERIAAHSNGAIMTASIIFAAGTFLGILRESGMLNSIAIALINFLPQFLLPYLHLVIGFFGIPLELILNTDAYYLALFPVVEQITTSAGVPPTSSAYALLIGNIVGTFISPFSPALWLGLGLANLSIGKHIRFSFFWMWAIALTLLLIAILINII